MSDLVPLMKPRSVAVVGASQRMTRATRVIANLQRFGYRGRIFSFLSFQAVRYATRSIVRKRARMPTALKLLRTDSAAVANCTVPTSSPASNPFG